MPHRSSRQVVLEDCPWRQLRLICRAGRGRLEGLWQHAGTKVVLLQPRHVQQDVILAAGAFDPHQLRTRWTPWTVT